MDEELKAALAEEERKAAEDSVSLTRMGGAMANELVKSYGFRRNAESGDWSWSLGNIAESFKEDPIWTSIDYAALLFSPAKFGLAAASIARGSSSAGVIGKGYKALKTGIGTADELADAASALGGKSATSKLGRAFQALGGDRELAAATEMKLAGPNRLHGVVVPGTNSVWGVASPLTVQTSPDYLKLAGRFDREVWEDRAILNVHQRERLLAENAMTRQAEDLVRSVEGAGLTKQMGERFVRLLETKITDSDIDSVIAREFAGDPSAGRAFKNTWGYRNTIHEKSFAAGLISRETYEENLWKWAPRMYEEYETQRAALGIIKPRAGMKLGKYQGPGVGASHPAARMLSEEMSSFAARKTAEEPEHLTRILDPRTSILRMADAGQTIAREEFAHGIAKSVLAVDPTEAMDDLIDLIATKDTKRLLLRGVTAEKIDAAVALSTNARLTNRPITGEVLLDHLGWRKAEELAENMPAALQGKYLDPRTAKDLVGVFNFMKEEPKWYGSLYKNILSTFRAGKTAYVPGTHVRNMLGGGIFAAMATGDVRAMVPLKGLAAFKDKNSALLREAAEAGVIGASFAREIHEGANLAAKTALDWLPPGYVADKIKGAASVAEGFYRDVDEVYKLEAWIRLKEGYEAVHGAGDVAKSLATVDVNKYMPSFLMHSELTDFLRKGIPFASFTSESMRVYRNLLAEKPHMVYFANHMGATLSEVFGAMAGHSPDQIEEAKKALPSYMQGKKTLLLPFDLDGQPRFLDLSYVIPMGSLSDAESSERFFFNAVMDPTTNPVLNIASAVATDRDAFSGREIAPDFTEKQLGIPVTGPRTRRAIGLGEHTLRTLLPPWAPPGYAFTNILEAVRGQVNPATGEELENGVFRTVLANMGGLRAYAPDVESQVKNVQEEQRRISEQVGQAWKRWEFARANGRLGAMEDEHQRILALKVREGHDDPEGYFAGSVKGREPYAHLSTKQLEKILARAEKLGALSPRDERIRTELMARYQSRKKKD